MTRHTSIWKAAMRPGGSLCGLFLLMIGVLGACDSGPVEPIDAAAPSSPPGVTGPNGGPPPWPPAGNPVPSGLLSENIFLAKADGTVTERLVPGNRPAWSPDGKRIAFHSAGLIRVINADGSKDAPLVAGSDPAWSPDGAMIAFTSSEGISIIDVSSLAVRTIVRYYFNNTSSMNLDMGVGAPAWSPDGARIAFVGVVGGDLDQVYVVDSDGSNPRLLTSTIDGPRYAESYPSWSPDGTRILYWSYGYGIAVIDSNGGIPTSINSGFSAINYFSKPVWSPDGSTIAYTRDPLTSSPAVWTMSATGRDVKMLIPNGYDAVWSPDGARIAFVRPRGD